MVLIIIAVPVISTFFSSLPSIITANTKVLKDNKSTFKMDECTLGYLGENPFPIIDLLIYTV